MYDLTARIRLVDDLTAPLRRATRQIDDMNNVSRQTTRSVASFAASFPAVASGAATATAAIAPLAAGAGGLAASFAAAGTGALAFGVVATSVLGDVFEAAEEVKKANEKLASADTAKERLAAQKELAEIYGDMSKSQAGALKELQSFQSFWSGFKKQFEDPIFQAFAQGLQATKGLLNGLKPTISNVADVVGELMTDMNNSFKNPEMQKFFNWLEVNAAESIRSFSQVAGNTFMGLAGIFQAFAPMGASVEEGLVKMTQRFREWAASLEGSKKFQQFIEYSKANAPALMNTFKNVFSILGQTVTALAPLGTVLLSSVEKFTSFVRNNFAVIKPLIIGVTTAFLGMKAIGAVITMISGAVTVFNVLKTAVTAGKVAFTLLRLSMLLFPGAWIIAAIGGVVAAGVWMYKNWDVVRAKAGQLWAWIKEKWSGIKQSTAETWGSVKSKIGSAMDSAKSKVSAFFKPLLSFIGKAKDKWDGLISKLKSFKMPKISMPSMPSWFSGGGGGGSEKADGRHYHGIDRIGSDGYKAVLHRNEAVLNAKDAKIWRQIKGIPDTPVKSASYKRAKPADRGGGSGGTTNNYLTVHYNGSGPLDEKQMTHFANWLTRKIDEAYQGGA